MWPFGRGDDTVEKPPKPNSESHSKTTTLELHEVTIEYLNGDVEQFEAYGVHRRTEEYIQFNIPPTDMSVNAKHNRAGFNHSRRLEMYSVLAREPILEPIEERRYLLTWTTDYDWRERPSWSIRDSKWEPAVVDFEYERID